MRAAIKTDFHTGLQIPVADAFLRQALLALKLGVKLQIVQYLPAGVTAVLQAIAAASGGEVRRLLAVTNRHPIALADAARSAFPRPASASR